MPDTFLVLDLVEGNVLVPVSDRLIVTSESKLETFTAKQLANDSEARRKNNHQTFEREHDMIPTHKGPQETFVTVDGRKNRVPVVQSFDEVKAMLTGAGFKIIEPPTPKGISVAKVARPENSKR